MITPFVANIKQNNFAFSRCNPHLWRTNALCRWRRNTFFGTWAFSSQDDFPFYILRPLLSDSSRKKSNTHPLRGWVWIVRHLSNYFVPPSPRTRKQQSSRHFCPMFSFQAPLWFPLRHSRIQEHPKSKVRLLRRENRVVWRFRSILKVLKGFEVSSSSGECELPWLSEKAQQPLRLLFPSLTVILPFPHYTNQQMRIV